MTNFTNEGETWANGILFKDNSKEDLYLRLFTNDVDLNIETLSLNNLTEVSGSGYSKKTLTLGNWTGNTTVEYTEQIFEATANDWNDVYGYYISTTTDDTGKLISGQQFANAPIPITSGQQIKVKSKVATD